MHSLQMYKGEIKTWVENNPVYGKPFPFLIDKKKNKQSIMN